MADQGRVLPCFICGKVLRPSQGNSGEGPLLYPSDGTVLHSFGHYGSTYWDSLDGEQIVIGICDEHLFAAHPDRVMFLRQSRRHPTRYVEIHRG